MADSQQDLQSPASQNVAQPSWQAEAQGVFSVWDMAWRAGQQVTQAVGGAVASRRDRKSVIMAQRSYYGQWTDLARHDGNRSKIPVLTKEKFRTYMESTDAQFNPGLPSAATAEWAMFLHALGIDPGKNVLSWRSPSASAGWTATPASQVKLEIDGEALCHIINIFGEDKPDPWGVGKELGEVEEAGTCDTTFATLQWSTANKDSCVSFSLKDDESICMDRTPFGSVGKLMEDGTRIGIYYYNTIKDQHGCSDTELVWPSPNTCLRERIQYLRIYIDMVQDRSDPVLYNSYLWKRDMSSRTNETRAEETRTFEEYLECYLTESFLVAKERSKVLAKPLALYYRKCARKKQPLLLSSRWLEEATRIGRRATSDDGEDRSFLEDVLKSIEGLYELRKQNLDEMVLRTEKAKLLIAEQIGCRGDCYAGDESLSALGCLFDKSLLSEGFIFKGDRGYRCLTGSRAPLPTSTQYVARKQVKLATNMVKKTLESYSNQPAGTWKRDLYDARLEVLWLVFTPKVIKCDPEVVRFLHFRPDSALWQGRRQIVPD